MQNWFDANPGAGSQLNTFNQQLVPHFNNISENDYTPTDISDAGDVAYSLENYFSQTGNPTLDWCVQSTILANVPSPGSASSVLFTEPTSTVLDDTYNQEQSYGYNMTYDQLAAKANIPNLSTWNTSNPLYWLCSNYCSSFLKTLSNGFFLAGGYMQTHDAYEKSLACQDLGEASNWAFGAAVSFLGLAGDLAYHGALGAAAAAVAVAAVLFGAGILAQEVMGLEGC